MICPNCGIECSETSKFCSVCGTALISEIREETVGEAVFETPDAEKAPDPVGNTTDQQNVLDTMFRFLKYRRLACKILGIYMLILSLFFIIFGLLFTGIGIVSLNNGSFSSITGMGFGYGITWLICGLLYLPIAFINFGMVSKANKFMNELYYNVRPAANYCGSIGRIVFCYFFNTIAMVFAIIGLVNVRSKSAIIDQIEYNQNLNR